MHHPKAGLGRQYIKKENGGRGLIQQELTSKTTTIGLKKYLDTTTDWMLQLVNTHTRIKRKNILLENKVINLVKQLDFTLKEIDIKDKTIKAAWRQTSTTTKSIKKKTAENKNSIWKICRKN